MSINCWPNSSVWKYFLPIHGEGDERKPAKLKDLQKVKDVALDTSDE